MQVATRSVRRYLAASVRWSSTNTNVPQISQEPKAPVRKYDPAMLPLTEPLDPTTMDFTEEQYAATLIHGRSVHEPFFHPRTHDIPVANIHFRSHHIPLLNLFTHFATHAAYSLGIPISKVVPLPTQRTLWTVPRSPFVHKKSQENFERKVHKRVIKAWDADSEVVAHWVAYLRAHVLAGVGMRVITWDRVPLGIGSYPNLAAIDNGLKNPSRNVPKQIANLGKQIIKDEAQGPTPFQI
ncbi:ribosomal protein S10 domain-containing protein [Gymnopilus junonius]|uniref:Small ribosomal subunit protein uS10m n=1 Tax=Gymnopilus junonius TaxID=109634 RepID=A0A9P5NBV2_GYMJU|nr:ribosomal protein S10 domain-containing protein [Gymnopilus junonius]